MTDVKGSAGLGGGLVLAGLLSMGAGGCDAWTSTAHAEGNTMAETKVYPVAHTDAEWKKLLTPQQYQVLRDHGTEQAFTGEYANFHGKAKFECAACGNVVFSSDDKFESGTGWPSFWEPVDPAKVETVTDTSYGMRRTEVRCSRCGSHLGHVFDDGPKPTGLRYCINSVALKAELPKSEK